MDKKSVSASLLIVYLASLFALVGSCFYAFVFKDKQIKITGVNIMMVEGVSVGYKKELEVNGVGYRAQKQGNNLVMNLGYSHQVIMPEVDGITVEVPNNNSIIISGADKQKVGQFAAEVREKRPPEPYKGKGIKYVGEYIRRKEGKAAKGSKK